MATPVLVLSLPCLFWLGSESPTLPVSFVSPASTWWVFQSHCASLVLLHLLSSSKEYLSFLLSKATRRAPGAPKVRTPRYLDVLSILQSLAASPSDTSRLSRAISRVHLLPRIIRRRSRATNRSASRFVAVRSERENVAASSEDTIAFT